MAKIFTKMEDSETVVIRLENDIIGLGFDFLDGEYAEDGMKIGVANVVELTISTAVAKELLQRLVDEVEFSYG